MAFFSWPPLSITAGGLATEAQQIIQTALLTTIDASLTSLDGKDFATETTLAAAAADLASLDAKDFATETTLAAAAADLASLDAKDFATETTLAAAAADLASLEAKDFATETTLAAINTKTPALGQATMANSSPVVIASDQTPINVLSDIGTISTNNSTTTPLGSGGTFTGTADEVTEFVAVGVFVSTDQDGTLFIDHSTDNVTWDKTESYALDVNVGGTPEGFFFQTLVMSRYTRIRYTNGGAAQGALRIQTVLKRNAGTAEVNAVSYPMLSTSEGLTTKSVIYGLSTSGGGTYVIAKVTPSGALNIEGTVTPSVAYNTGNSSATTQRVVIASDQPALPQGAGNSVVTTFRRDYSAASVDTTTWVQLVASLGSTVKAIEIFDSSGQTLELGTGAAASETRLIYVFPGGNGRIPVAIASGTRVSLRAVSATANVGEITINFYG